MMITMMAKTVGVALGLALSASAISVSAPTETTLKSKFGPQATRLARATDYVRSNPAPDFWAMMPYYLPQQTGSACSIASVTMMINAARVAQDLPASEALATQDGVLKKVGDTAWTRSVGRMGGGVSLEELGKNTLKAAQAFGFAQARVDVVHADAPLPEFQKSLVRALEENEKSARDFILINFKQSEFTGDPEGGGHIAPIAAYDSANKSVLIFDPDREWYEPYWVSVDTLVKGMATQDSGAKRPRGYVHIKLGT